MMLTRASFAIFLSVSLSAQTQGTITTYAGNGTSLYSNDGGQATSTGIGGGGQSLTVALDSGGNLYIADQANDRVRRVSSGGSISTFAGGGSASGLGDGGQATNAKVFPNGIAIESLGNVFIASGAQVRKVATNGIITTIAGTGIPGNSGDGGAATSAQFQATSVAVDGFGNLYIADALANRIRKVNSVGVISTFAGIGAGGFSGDGGPATAARLQLPQGVAADAVGNAYFVDSGSRIRKVNAVGIISTYGGNGSPIGLGEGITATATGMTPSNVVADGAGNLFYSDTGTNRVRRISVAGLVTTVAGTGLPGFTGDNGPATSATLFSPRSLAIDAVGNLYVADTFNYRIRMIWGVAEVAAAGPAIFPNGVVNGASFLPGITPNGWATIQGSGLSEKTATSDNSIVNGRLPTSLEGVSVTIDGVPAYIAYVSPTQINLLVPDVAVGPKVVVVTTPAGATTSFTVISLLYDPAFFTWPGSQPVSSKQDYTFAARSGTFPSLPTTPAKPCEVLILWGVGFGPTSPPIPFGIQVPTTTTYSTTIPPVVTINGVRTTVYGAAPAPGFAGLYQVAIEVPLSLPDGDWPIGSMCRSKLKNCGLLSQQLGFELQAFHSTGRDSGNCEIFHSSWTE